MSAPRVTVYTSNFCGYCVAAKRLLQRDEIPFEEVDLSGDPARRAELVTQTGWRTVPMIFIDGELIGGYQELAALRSGGGLDGLRPTA